MQIPFTKYQGTGNDFVMLDQRHHTYIDHKNISRIAAICDRKFGVGCDGLILLEKDDHVDFKMVYFNSDGNQSSMCGNGGRCIVKFAHDLGLIEDHCVFSAIDGLHEAKIDKEGLVHLKMNDVTTIKKNGDGYVLNTGSPHYVQFVDKNPASVKEAGANIRFSEVYQKDGINVNFCILKEHNLIQVATYERGVEDETLSCGTGVVASTIAFHLENNVHPGDYKVNVLTKGGELAVNLTWDGQNFYDIWLIGPAIKVFTGFF
jgi:diaminopimelate epimerase